MSENQTSKKTIKRRMTFAERLLAFSIGVLLIAIGTGISMLSLIFDFGGMTAGHGFKDSGLFGWIGAIPSSLGLIAICIALFDWTKTTPQIVEDEV